MLGADCTYAPELATALLVTIKQLLTRQAGSIAYVAASHRSEHTSQHLHAEIRRLDLTCTLVATCSSSSCCEELDEPLRGHSTPASIRYAPTSGPSVTTPGSPSSTRHSGLAGSAELAPEGLPPGGTAVHAAGFTGGMSLKYASLFVASHVHLFKIESPIHVH